MSDYLDINNEELLKDFFSEAEQQVDTLESNILVIENDPSNHDAIDEIFRAAHTLKGGSATVEMSELAEFTHVVEDLLDALRSNMIKVTEPVVDVLLSSIDIIKSMLEARSNGTVYDNDVEPIKAKLRSFIPESGDKKQAHKKPPITLQAAQAASAAPDTVPVQSGENLGIVPPETMLSEYDMLELKNSCTGDQKLWAVSVLFDESNPMNSVGGIQVFAALKDKGTVLRTIPDFDELYEDTFHPSVVYFIASSSSQDDLEDTAFMSDVTTCVDARCMDSVEAALGKTVKAEPVPVNTPVPEAPKPVAKAETPAAGPAPAVPAKQDAAKKNTGAQASHNNAGSILRVDSKRIDYLLNLVSETVIAKAAFNQIAMQIGDLQASLQSLGGNYKEKMRALLEQMPAYLEQIQSGASLKEVKASMIEEFGDLISFFDGFESSFKSVSGRFRASTQNLGRIAGELQEGVMKIRMVPINQIFSRFPRVVRDLSRELNKKINLEIEGEDTELDKSVIEDLLDPIMHCVRNSADHGIETPEERAEAGKPEEGVIQLKASNEGNMIIIDIADDGAGIDVRKVRAKAIERGIIHPNKVISDQEAYQLIFEAGFSTSDTISNISGRGVGLDVVKTMIEKLNGTVTVTSEYGMGSRFSIRLPLTLAIIQGLLVRVGTEVYSIPVATVIESHRVKLSEISTIDNYEVLNVRNEVISVLRLSRLFNIKNKVDSDHYFIVIVGSADKKIGVMVDSLIGEEDVVIKPLRDQFTNSPGIAGASILGDGSVSLIIDVSQLLELGVRQERNARETRERLTV